ncbi:hypothetical protein E4T44_01579 [Aureobasidium sp. EXF-8845]|nr:hypothetical protein E4T44_01579 [Aureobasidium sp. EXF-8845]KAI4857007.1 hypothetical protein E4T45_01514 [Aureobasidium sp. EXF-8846]
MPSHAESCPHIPSLKQSIRKIQQTSLPIAGSIAARRKIDYDLNLSLAKSAKASGVEIYVLISTSGASPTSRIA